MAPLSLNQVLRLRPEISWARSDLLLALLMALSLLPLWIFPFFATQDGPAHVENANILLNYANPARPELGQFYMLNFSTPTNWLGHLVLAALMSVAPPLLTEKLFLSVYVIAFPVAVRYALRAIQPQASWIACAIFPSIYSFVLYKGFYNFCASLPLYFFLIGYWLRRRDHLSRRATLVLTLLSLVLYAAHVVSWVMACLGIGILTLWFCASELRSQRALHLTLLRRRVAPFVIVSLVPAILIVLFVLRGTGEPISIQTNWATPLANLMRLTTLVALDAREYWLAAALALGLGSMGAYQIFQKLRLRQLNEWDGLLLVMLAYGLMYLIAPAGFAGGSFVKQRLMLYPYLILVLWLGAQKYSTAVRRATQLLVSSWMVILIVIRLGAQSELNAQLEDLYSVAPHISQNSTMMPLTFASHAVPDEESSALSRIRVMLHGAGYLAATRSSVDLTNYEARTDYFPLRFRETHSPLRFASRLASGRPQMDLAGYAQEKQVLVDYVLLIAEDVPFRPGFKPPPYILAQLEQGYNRVYTSPRGFVYLYQRRD